MKASTRLLIAGFAVVATTAAGAAPALAATTAHARGAVVATDGCSSRHGAGFCGTWKDVNNRQYVAASGTPKAPHSSDFTFFGFRADSAPAASTSFFMFHPAQFSADNGAVAQFSNAGRSELPAKYLAGTYGGQVVWSSVINRSAEWVYDGYGFYNGQTGQFLVIGLHGALWTSHFQESQTDFIPAA